MRTLQVIVVLALMVVSSLSLPRPQRAEAREIQAVAVGGQHTCVLTSAGGVECWGSNTYGELGDGTTTNRSTPAAVQGLSSGVISIVAGDNHTCALTSQRGIKCWGANVEGQIGDGQACDSFGCTTPVDVPGLSSGVAALGAGASYTCVVTSAGDAKCWGQNGGGQLGDGNAPNVSTTPVDVCEDAACAGNLAGVVAVSGGINHTCALMAAGGVKCWGMNGSGQLGDGTATMRTTPVSVCSDGTCTGDLTGIGMIAVGGGHTCAVSSVGALLCWGENYYGSLGDGNSPADSATPIVVSGMASGAATVAAGSFHTCALTTAGVAKCWGWNEGGQVGDGTWTQRDTPQTVCSDAACTGSLVGVSEISAGVENSCAVTKSGGLACWGLNGLGQLGDGRTLEYVTPADVVGISSGATAVAAGDSHLCAIAAGGGVKCWGWNDEGGLGDGTRVDTATPVDVIGIAAGAAQVSGGSRHTCAVVGGGSAKCWGGNGSGELGDGTTQGHTSPVDVCADASCVGNLTGVASISAGSSFTCALTGTGSVKCWGGDGSGQLGDDQSCGAGCTTPVDVCADAACATDLGSVASMDTGGLHACVVTSTGSVKCWGYNGMGQLGDGSNTQSNTPVDVCSDAACLSDLSSVDTVSAGFQHTCAVTSTGGVKCWGWNGGRLGDGTGTNRNTPVDVCADAACLSDLSGASAVAAGGNHTCALMSDSTVKCWGKNSFGQLGDGTRTARSAPMDVCADAACLTSLSGVSSVTVGFNQTCALMASGGVKCWGQNFSGQVGDGGVVQSAVPVSVSVTALADWDHDGCVNSREFGLDPTQGGLRNPKSFWDFYDVPTGSALTRDGNVASLDIFQVLGRFNATDTGPGDFDRNSDPLSTPNAVVGGAYRANYHPAYDRGPLVGPNIWDLGPADGSIAAPDIFAVLAQFGHSCA